MTALPSASGRRLWDLGEGASGSRLITAVRNCVRNALHQPCWLIEPPIAPVKWCMNGDAWKVLPQASFFRTDHDSVLAGWLAAAQLANSTPTYAISRSGGSPAPSAASE